MQGLRTAVSGPLSVPSKEDHEEDENCDNGKDREDDLDRRYR